MVTCELVGRTGNQMFIIACTIATALKHGLEYHIPAHTLNDDIWEPKFTNLEDNRFNPSLPNIYVPETTHAYKEIILDESLFYTHNFVIRGYRQSEKYFKDYIDEVRYAFGFEYLPKHNFVCVHHRLGDYKLYPDKHVIVSDKYIYDSVKFMKQKGYGYFIIFSDEPDKVNLPVDIEANFVYSKNYSDLDDFQNMLWCRSFIISASTFSLMASILSESENKICIAPKEWFGISNSHLDTKDIVPENYIRL